MAQKINRCNKCDCICRLGTIKCPMCGYDVLRWEYKPKIRVVRCVTCHWVGSANEFDIRGESGDVLTFYCRQCKRLTDVVPFMI
jgi:hypothetical protein